MTDDRGEVLIEGEKTTIVFRRVLSHSIDRVWKAITDPGELAAWLVQSALVDARVGGRIEYVSSPNPVVWYGTIRVWEPPRVYEHELNTDPDPRFSEHIAAERAIARWELESRGASTLLTLTFRGFTRPVAGGFAPGTHAYLERLEALLASAPLPDWQRRFDELHELYRADIS